MEAGQSIKLWTVGHSTRTLAEFLELITDNDIRVVADVRSYPGSRRYPHFNAENLSVSLHDVHVEYVHLKALGGRRKPRPDSQNTVWRHPSFRAYADYMETDAFKHGIDGLLALARANSTAIMCSEAVWWRCHRSMISDFLKAKGMIVEHIIDTKQTVEHPFTSAARLENDELVYGPEQPVIPFPKA